MKVKTLLIIFALFALNLQAQEKVNFSEKFKKENQGKYKIEVNELKELIHIMIAITKSGLENDDMIQQQSNYYKEVINYFKPYENEPIIKEFDSLLSKSLYNYIYLTGNAISYDFKGNKLIKNPVFDFPATNVAYDTIRTNPITIYKNQIEAFAKKTDFKKFYNSHQKFYSQIISDYDKYANLQKQWNWLEKNFNTRINSYEILCSPLINGLNYTAGYDNNDYKFIQMVLPPLDKDEKLSKIQNEVFNTRVMFTEIDHNYCHAPTEKNEEKINEVLKNRGDWVNEKIEGTYAYPNQNKVFGEYITFGVFLLYCQDNYDEATFKQAYNDIINIMDARGFIRMKIFTDNLLKVRNENKNIPIDDLYPLLLNKL